MIARRKPIKSGVQRKKRGDGPRAAYEFLRGEIISMRLPPGARIEERRIVEDLGLSRTPVRQALMRMASEGLVETLPNHGARVPPLDIEDVRAFFEAFEFMLRATSHLAAKRWTEQDMVGICEFRTAYEHAAEAGDVYGMIDANENFHLAIARAGHNGHMVRLVGDLLTKAVRIDGLWYGRRPALHAAKDIERSVREHKSLVGAIAKRDASEAERLTLAHVHSFREPLTKFLCESEAEHIGIAQAESRAMNRASHQSKASCATLQKDPP